MKPTADCLREKQKCCEFTVHRQRSEHLPECQSSGSAQLLFETGSLSHWPGTLLYSMGYLGSELPEFPSPLFPISASRKSQPRATTPVFSHESWGLTSGLHIHDSGMYRIGHHMTSADTVPGKEKEAGSGGPGRWDCCLKRMTKKGSFLFFFKLGKAHTGITANLLMSF